MRSVQFSAAALVAMAAGQVASAQWFEGFEHGDWAGNYTAISGATPYPLLAADARSGVFGVDLNSSSWWRSNSNVISDGDTMEYYFRGTGGRAYIGFTSTDSATEAYTVVAAPNTTNLLIQRNSGFGFVDIATSSAITWSGTDFYKVVMSYSGGVITAEAFDAGGISLAPPIMAATGYSGGGAMLFRAFGGGSVDDINVGGGTSTSIQSLGDAAPPSQLCRKDVVAFGPDNRPLLNDVTSVPHPVCGGGDLEFSIAMSHRRIGSGWGTWSHGYTGDVYYTNGAASVKLGMPASTSRFYTYVEPNPFADIEFEISSDSARGIDMTTAVISGSSGAQGFGFCDDGGINSVGVRTTDGVTDFAIGEFGICTDTSGGCPRCLADCDGSGSLDFFDFLCYQNLFGAGDCCADCDGSGSLDFFDFLCFQNAFAEGCPELELVQLGVEAPPSVLCSVRLTPFPADPRPTFGDETTVASPLGGNVTFSTPCSHRIIGGGWGSWSHGYTGDVYYTNGAASLDVGVPANSAFYLYVEPNPFALIEFEITGTGGGAEASVVESINGSSGAAGYAFCGGVENVNVRTTDGITDFAVGEFGIAN